VPKHAHNDDWSSFKTHSSFYQSDSSDREWYDMYKKTGKIRKDEPLKKVTERANEKKQKEKEKDGKLKLPDCCKDAKKEECELSPLVQVKIPKNAPA